MLLDEFVRSIVSRLVNRILKEMQQIGTRHRLFVHFALAKLRKNFLISLILLVLQVLLPLVTLELFSLLVEVGVILELLLLESRGIDLRLSL